MNRILSCLMVLALAGLARADETEAKAEAQIKRLLEIMSKTIPVLETVKDKATAEKAKPELSKLFEEMDKLAKEFSKAPDAVKDKLQQVYKPQFQALQPRYRKEVERLSRDDAVAKLLADLGPFKTTGSQRELLARYKVVALEQALKVYQLKHEKLPESLEALAAGDAPVIEKKDLKDPWGKAYQFDPKGAKNKGLKPDIWTTDPSGKVIGNWEAKPAPKDK